MSESQLILHSSPDDVELTFRVSKLEAIKLLQFSLGTPAFGVIIFLNKGEFMSDSITGVDSDPPFTATVAWADIENQPTTPAGGTRVDVDDSSVCNVIQEGDNTWTFNWGSPGATLVHFHPLDQNGDVIHGPDDQPIDVVGTVSCVAGNAVTGVVNFQPGNPTGS